MAIKKIIIEVEEGITDGCDICPFQTALLGSCKNPPELDCFNYDLATMKIYTEDGTKEKILKEVIEKASEWFEKYLFDIGYPDDWCRDSPNLISGKDRFIKAMQDESKS